MARTKEFDEDTVLQRARDLFWGRGYSATSIQDLEQHLGISRSSIYRFFGGKRELYDRTLSIYQEDRLGYFQRQLSQAQSLRVALIEMFAEAARQQHSECQNEARGCYVVNATTELASSSPEASSFAAGNRERFVAIMVGALEQAVHRGELPDGEELTAWANYLYICYNGLQVVVQTRIDRDVLVEAVSRGVDALPWSPAV